MQCFPIKEKTLSKEFKDRGVSSIRSQNEFLPDNSPGPARPQVSPWVNGPHPLAPPEPLQIRLLGCSPHDQLCTEQMGPEELVPPWLICSLLNQWHHRALTLSSVCYHGYQSRPITSWDWKFPSFSFSWSKGAGKWEHRSTIMLGSPSWPARGFP